MLAVSEVFPRSEEVRECDTGSAEVAKRAKQQQTKARREGTGWVNGGHMQERGGKEEARERAESKVKTAWEERKEKREGKC